MILKNAFLLNKSDTLDIKIENGIITDIDKCLNGEGIDLKGKILSRGLIDMHCHLREPGYEYKETIETGIFSAIQGGYTAICPMANTNPVCDTPKVVGYILSKSGNYNLFPICATTKGLAGIELSDIKVLKNAGAIAFSNDGKPVSDQKLLENALSSGELIISHAEITELNGTPESEYKAVKQELDTLRRSGGRYHFAHISTKESVDMIRKAKKEGLNVTCETAPHYISLIKSAEIENNPVFKVNPPLREEADRLAVIEGLKDGTIDVLATDHAPHSKDEKMKPYAQSPMGIAGFETSLAVGMTYLKDKLSLEQILDKYTKNPAKILGIPEFGEIKIGNTANMTVIDKDYKWVVKGEEFKSKCKFTPFEGDKLCGKAVMTIVNGVVYENK